MLTNANKNLVPLIHDTPRLHKNEIYFPPLPISMLSLREFNPQTPGLSLLTQSKNNILASVNQILSQKLFFYVSPAETTLRRAVSLKFFLLQKSLYNALVYQRFVNDRLTELNIIRKRDNKNLIRFLLHKVSIRLIHNITHREQVPPFSEISPLRRISTSNRQHFFL